MNNNFENICADKKSAFEVNKKKLVDNIIELFLDSNLTICEANEILSSVVSRVKQSKLSF